MIAKATQPSRKLCAYLTLVALFLCLFSLNSRSQTVTPWMTTGDQSKLIQQQSTVSFGTNTAQTSSSVTLITGTTYQTMDGFGWAMTEGSCELILSLASTQQSALLNELYNPSTGLSSAVVRISIGASDLSSSSYSYDETAGDVNMNSFSLSGPDLTNVVPVLQKILAINPSIKILATPWTAPRWMKSNNAWVGGNLQTQYYAAYGLYFVKYLQAMKALGINIWAVTPQNEPGNPNNEPSMTMTSTEEKNFINQQLGPQMASAGFGAVKIIGYDHNCDNTAYPIDVATSSYVDGSAFHLYAGDISAMTTVHNSTNKNVYFTEQYTGSPSNFSGDFGWHIQNVVIGSANNWGKTAIEWNVASNPSLGPRTPGGCTTCLGAVTISNSTTYTRNVQYYNIGQISKFAKAGSLRFSTSSNNSSITSAGFKNPDGSIALLVYNSGGANTVRIISGSAAFDYSIPASSAVTFNWATGATVAVTGVSVSPASASVSVNNTVQLTATVSPSNATNKNVTWSSSNTAVATVNSSGLVTGVAAGTATITVTTSDGNKTATSTITVTTVAVTGVTVSPTSASIAAGQTQQLTATVAPSNASNKNVTWTSSNTAVATVSATGLVTAVAAGTATITVTTQDGSKTATSSITVTVSTTGYPGYYNIISKNSGKGLDVTGNSTTSGAQIQQYDIANGGGSNQRWRFDDAGSGNYYIKVKSTLMCLAPADNSTGDGVKVQQKTCATTNDFKWTVTSLGSGYYKIINLNSGKSLDVEGVSTSNGANIQVWTYGGGANQQWQLVQVETTTGKMSNTASGDNSTLPFDIKSSNKDVVIYPNPAKNSFKVVQQGNSKSTLELYTLSGEAISKQIFTHERVIDISSLQLGTYMVKITTGKNTFYKKVIKL